MLAKRKDFKALDYESAFLTGLIFSQLAPKETQESSWCDSHHGVSCLSVSFTIHQLFWI